jgi:hypothetical protein
MASKICISSGHGKYIRGASGYLDEVDEARRVVVTCSACEERRRALANLAQASSDHEAL